MQGNQVMRMEMLVSRLAYVFLHWARFDFCVGICLKIGDIWLEGDADVVKEPIASEVLTNITKT
jgi:hypothetical protein